MVDGISCLYLMSFFVHFNQLSIRILIRISAIRTRDGSDAARIGKFNFPLIGNRITATAGVISAAEATSSTPGIVQPDNSSITIASGVISVPDGSDTVKGVVQVDGTTITAASGVISATGTVSSVGLTMPAEFDVASSPVTNSGTIAVTKATQAANTVYAGPSSGSPDVPAFRALTAADMPVAGVTGTVTLAALTPGGTQGSLTITNGLITAIVNPT